MEMTKIKDGVDKNTLETVKSVGGKYKHGWETGN